MTKKDFLDSLDDPRLEAYRDLKDAKRLAQDGLFIAEGGHLVTRLLTSGFETESVLVAESRAETLQRDLGCQIPPDVPVHVLTEEVIQELVGFQFHRGILACGRRQPSPTLEEVLPTSPEPALLVVCPETGQAENLGQIIRSSRSFGADAVLLGESCCDPFSRRALRVSMGNAFHIPIVQSHDLAHDLNALRIDWDVEVVGTALDRRAVPLPDAELPARMGLVFGNEAEGIRPTLHTFCDHFVRIPMADGADSLNVGVAAGIFLYHFTYLRDLQEGLASDLEASAE